MSALNTVLYWIKKRKSFESTNVPLLFKSGIYWSHDGNDPRLPNAYLSTNVNSHTLHYHKLFLINKIHLTPEKKYDHTGAMIRSKYSYDLSIPYVFKFKCDVPSMKNVKTALWFKSTTKDIDEVDIMECFNWKTCFFSKKIVKLLFTDHHGTDYEKDHEFNPTTVWANKAFEITFTTGEYFRWYLNGKLVKKAKNTIKSKCELIADIGANVTINEHFNPQKFILDII